MKATNKQRLVILADAPDGATHYNPKDHSYLKYDTTGMNSIINEEGEWEYTLEFHSHVQLGYLCLHCL